MGRPNGTKNVMRTPEEKERLIKEYLDSGKGYGVFAREKRIEPELFRKWKKQYEEKGIEGFKRKIGSGSPGRPKNPKDKLEQLELEILKLRIENERLKKGYFVKGDGARKEYGTSLEKNTK